MIKEKTKNQERAIYFCTDNPKIVEKIKFYLWYGDVFIGYIPMIKLFLLLEIVNILL